MCARKEGCRLGGGWASGMIVDRIVQVASRARIAGCRLGGGCACWMCKWHGCGWGRLRVIRARKAGCRLRSGLVSGMVREGSLKLVPGLDEQVVVEEVDEIAG